MYIGCTTPKSPLKQRATTKRAVCLKLKIIKVLRANWVVSHIIIKSHRLTTTARVNNKLGVSKPYKFTTYAYNNDSNKGERCRILNALNSHVNRLFWEGIKLPENFQKNV